MPDPMGGRWPLAGELAKLERETYSWIVIHMSAGFDKPRANHSKRGHGPRTPKFGQSLFLSALILKVLVGMGELRLFPIVCAESGSDPTDLWKTGANPGRVSIAK